MSAVIERSGAVDSNSQEQMLELDSSERRFDRRRFLQLVAAGVGAAIGYGAYREYEEQTTYGSIPDEWMRYDQKLSTGVHRLHEVYGLEVYVSPAPAHTGRVGFEPARRVQLLRVVEDVSDAIRVYPPWFFRYNNISPLVVVHNLTLHGVDFAGLFVRRPYGMYIDAAESRQKVKSTFHHEVFHNADLSLLHTWDSLFDCSCAPYIEDDGVSGDVFYPDDHARKNEKEHRAEIAERLMVPSEHSRLHAVVELLMDEEMKRNAQEQIMYVKREYLEFSRGVMDDNYWHDLVVGNVDENYFSG